MLGSSKSTLLGTKLRSAAHIVAPFSLTCSDLSLVGGQSIALQVDSDVVAQVVHLSGRVSDTAPAHSKGVASSAQVQRHAHSCF